MSQNGTRVSKRNTPVGVSHSGSVRLHSLDEAHFETLACHHDTVLLKLRIVSGCDIVHLLSHIGLILPRDDRLKSERLLDLTLIHTLKLKKRREEDADILNLRQDVLSRNGTADGSVFSNIETEGKRETDVTHSDTGFWFGVSVWYASKVP